MEGLVMPAALAILLAISLPAGYYEIKARHHLSVIGKQNPWLVYFLGLLAGKQYFTEEGWAYHRRAVDLGLLASVLFVGFFLAGLFR